MSFYIVFYISLKTHQVNIFKLENVFMKHYAPNYMYMLASKRNISQIKAKPKSTIIFVAQWHQLSEHE